MANDGEINVKTKIDNSEVDKGLNDLNNKIKDAEKSAENAGGKFKKFDDALGKINLKTVATAAGFAAVAKGVKKTVEALDDCQRAYQAQRKAEIALQTAAKNNPYLNEESVYNLKQFAGELQNMSEVGDEISIKVMAELAATGRTENEIIQIMSAAADMAAVTGEDIGSAAQKLNMTFSGMTGTLGRTNGAIKDLTAEELKAGKAVEIVAAQYKGAAANSADVTKQLSNAWGDFKENIGKGWDRVTKPVKQFFLDILADMNSAKAKADQMNADNAARENGTADAAVTKRLLDEAQSRADTAQTKIKETMALLEDEDALNKKIQESRGYVTAATFKKLLTDLQKTYESETLTVNQLTEEYNNLAAAEQAAADAAAQKKKADDAAAKKADRDKQAAEYIAENTNAVNRQIDALKIKAEIMGEDVDAQKIADAYLQSYINLITQSNGLVTENNTAAKKRLELLEAWLQKAKEANEESEKQNALDKAKKESEKLLAEINKDSTDGKTQRMLELDDLRKRLDADEVMSAEDKKAALLKIDKEYKEESEKLKKENTLAKVEEIKNYTEQAVNIAQNAAALMIENQQAETNAELLALENKYQKGELAESEYYEKQKEIKRKAAQEEYKIRMFEWTASVLAATANIAEGVSKAIAQGGTAGLITGALVSAAGAVQIASIIASKPTVPAFATGGVIGGMNGASMGGDNTYIHARRGEMVLNANQQRSLWDKITGANNNGGLNVTVNETTGRVDTNIRETRGGLTIDILDKHINAGFMNGDYDAGVAGMNTRQEGVKIL